MSFFTAIFIKSGGRGIREETTAELEATLFIDLERMNRASSLAGTKLLKWGPSGESGDDVGLK